MYESDNEEGCKGLSFTVSKKLFNVIERLRKDLFRNRSEFIRFCINYTLIAISESEFIKSFKIKDIKRFIKLDDKRIEINGNMYSIVNEEWL